MTSARDKKKIAEKIKNAILGIDPDRDRLESRRRREAFPALSRVTIRFLESRKLTGSFKAGKFQVRSMALPDPKFVYPHTGRAFRIDCGRGVSLFAGLYFPPQRQVTVLFWDRFWYWEREFYDAVLEAEKLP